MSVSMKKLWVVDVGNGMSTFLVITVMGKNSDDDVYSPSCARRRRRDIHRFRHMHT